MLVLISSYIFKFNIIRDIRNLVFYGYSFYFLSLIIWKNLVNFIFNFIDWLDFNNVNMWKRFRKEDV